MGRRILVQESATCFVLGAAYGKIVFGALCSDLAADRTFRLAILGRKLFYLPPTHPLRFDVFLRGRSPYLFLPPTPHPHPTTVCVPVTR